MRRRALWRAAALGWVALNLYVNLSVAPRAVKPAVLAAASGEGTAPLIVVAAAYAAVNAALLALLTALYLVIRGGRAER